MAYYIIIKLFLPYFSLYCFKSENSPKNLRVHLHFSKRKSKFTFSTNELASSYIFYLQLQHFLLLQAHFCQNHVQLI